MEQVEIPSFCKTCQFRFCFPSFAGIKKSVKNRGSSQVFIQGAAHLSNARLNALSLNAQYMVLLKNVWMRFTTPVISNFISFWSMRETWFQGISRFGIIDILNSKNFFSIHATKPDVVNVGA